MKTSEFINELKKMGYEGQVSYAYRTIDIYPKGLDGAIASVRLDRRFTLEVGRLHHPVSEDLWALLIEYSSTPVKEREEEKRYYVKLKGLDILEGTLGSSTLIMELTDVLNYHPKYKSWNLLDKSSFEGFQAQFTLKELRDLGVDTELYDLEEVEE